jgi:enoyl-CoA hydratase/carnithine racemase
MHAAESPSAATAAPADAAVGASESDFVPPTEDLIYERHGGVAFLTFNRPRARNAMTEAMYQGLYECCAHVDADDRVRVLVLKGAGDKAFVAGTDISYFVHNMNTAQDALDYEDAGSRNIGAVERMRKPTIALLRGFCTGGGAMIAAVCDLRIATPDVKFGFPIARTLGNILSMENFARLVALLGPARTKQMLFTADFIEAEEGKAAGLFNEIVPHEQIERRVVQLAEQIAGNAPLTVQASKEAIRRILEHERPPADHDLIELCYMSEDFREGVRAFLEKRPAQWKGR